MAMSTATRPSGTRRLWHIITGHAGPSGPHGLPATWMSRPDRTSGFEVLVGPGGVFVIGRSPSPRLDADLVGAATILGSRLTARLGYPVAIQPVRVLTSSAPQPADQFGPVTVVSADILGDWLAAHPGTVSERDIMMIAHTAGQAVGRAA